MEIKAYNNLERKARDYLPNRAVEAFVSSTFNMVGYPTNVTTEQGIAKYADTMHEYTYELLDTNSHVSKEEAILINKICDSVQKYTHSSLDSPIQPWLSLIDVLPLFRIVSSIKKAFNHDSISVFEVGPGSGYLGAFLTLAGNKYASMDNTQAFYLWQNRFYSSLFGNDVYESAEDSQLNFDLLKTAKISHLPWWHFASLYKEKKLDLSYDIVICDHALAEMTDNAFKYLLKLANTMLGNSKIGLFLFTHSGSTNHSNMDIIQKALISNGFTHVCSEPFQAFASKNSELKQFPLKLRLPQGYWSTGFRRYLSIINRFYNKLYLLFKRGILKPKHPFFNIRNSELYNLRLRGEAVKLEQLLNFDSSCAPPDYPFLDFLGFKTPIKKRCFL